MKEQTTYVAVDADNAGVAIGEAVLNDDTDSLSSISQNINGGTQIFTQWAEFNGGEVISNGSDEAIVRVPITSVHELETLKIKYQDQTGFKISIGMGESVSSAAKALIYAKMNGKDQIVDYSPEMEEAMKQAMSPEGVVESENTLPHQEVSEEEIPDHEQELAPEEKAIHDETEMVSDEEEIEQEEMAAIGEETLEEEMPEEEAMDEMVDSVNPQEEDIDLDGRPDQDEVHGEITPEDDIDGDGDVEHEEAIAVEAEAEEGYSDEADFADEEEEEFIDEESTELKESIEGEMSEEDGEIPAEEVAEEEMPEEDGFMLDEEHALPEEEGELPMEEEESADSESLKSIIFESLQNFKQNREYLEGMSSENPELYNSLIYVLQAMIEMARELGYGDMDAELQEEPLEEMSDEETMNEAEEIEEEMEGEDRSEGFEEEEIEEDDSEEDDSEEEVEEEDGKENKNPFAKHEKFVKLIKKMNKAFKSSGLEKKEEAASIEELKEKLKEKKSKQGQTGKKMPKRKKTAKKAKSASVGKKKDKEKKGSGGNSFCAKSHVKMKAAGKDCRANEDADSPVCAARKKFNCRGKNEEKGGVHKAEECDGDFKTSEKLSKFLSKKRKK